MAKIKDIVSSICLFFLLLNPVLAQTTAAILPQGKTQFLDNNGNPLSSGKVYFYIPSTTTFKTTWQDASKTIANANPVVLDAGGRAIIYGDGTYRQRVFNSANTLIYDAVTASAGTGGGTTGTGDGDLVGTVKPWAGLVPPNQYVFAYGQEISRSTYAAFFTAVTLNQTFACTSGSPILTGLSDTSQIPNGAVLESTCVAAGSTVLSKTSTTVTMNANASLTTGTSGVFFLYGNGNGTTTFNVPDLRGLTVVGRANMGGTAISYLNSTYYGTNPSSTGAIGGNQNQALNTTNLPPYIPAGIIGNITAAGTVSAPTISLSAASTNVVNTGAGGSANLTGGGGALLQATITASASAPTFTGSPVSGGSFTGTAQGGTSAPFTTIQPSRTLNYIVKITPDQNSADASGVTSFGLMTGDIACGSGLLCTGNVVSVNSFNLTVGSSAITSGTSNGVLYNNAGILGNSNALTNAVLLSNSSGTPYFSNSLSLNGDVILTHPLTPSPDNDAGTNISLGKGAMSSLAPIHSTQYITAIGFNAGRSLTTADHITVIGAWAGAALTDATTSSNTLIGLDSGRVIAVGTGNVALGEHSLTSTTNSVGNTAIGFGALYQIGSSSLNTGLGQNAMLGGLSIPLTGSNNLAAGANSMGAIISTSSQNTALGGETLSNLTTANGNTAVGFRAGQIITTGSNNTIIGNAGATTLATGSENILIGTVSHSADTPTASTSNYLNIGNTITGTLGGAITFVSSVTSNATGAGSNSGFIVSSTDPGIAMRDTAGGVDGKLWDWRATSNLFTGRAVNDATTVATNWLSVLRSTTNITSVTFPSSPVIFGTTGTTLGSTQYSGSSTGTATISAQAVAGTPSILWPTTSGTVATTATSPITLNSTTGVVACGTCGVTGSPLSQFASTTSAQLAGVISDETGSGALVFGTSPSLTTPSLGVATATTINGVTLDNNAWITYTPTITASSGTFTTVSATGAYKQIGKSVFVRIQISITTNGTAAGRVEATLPVNVSVGLGIQSLNALNSSIPLASVGLIAPAVATNKVLIFKADGTYPGANATELDAQGVYEVP